MHRPLSAYTTALFRVGLVITGLRERDEREVPWLLVIRAEKRSWVRQPSTAAQMPPATSSGTADEFPG